MIRKTLFVAAALLCVVAVQAQTLDEILTNYFENTGGVDKWRAVEGIQMEAKLNQQGMELPLTIVQLKDGRQMTSISFQGKEIKQGVYDGSTLWGTNFMNMKAEKSDAEATENFKRNLGDFPDPFLDYAKKGYKAELMGKETVEGTETFKIKLTKKPVLVDGKEEENISYYFFDVDNFVPIMVESEVKSGPAKGMVSQSTMSDYQEVSGLMMPFSMTQGVKGSPGQPITMTSIVVNPTVDGAVFKFPEEQK
ncbi:MAG: outer membrane lipoprotein-sorting protein [Flammeovirgaceae bacterium]|nr:outer membrane lipoprotein-sorting protein [Flammeovirgaceae bacterium]